VPVPQQPKPTVCRLVHYVSYGTPGGEFTSECRAAIITEVTGQLADTDQWRVGLFVANPTGLFLNRDVGQDEETKAGGTWHWPERAE
jgi:hypothetical protein